ncbi:TonB-dependent receptor plug domain-containing protein [Rhizorhapis sp. SPR117]|uniref:TonB-dependent receptor plug domain-containing protein n=1 Tax=Rhizorhapis sp. SPR117 TaxID=2912611 RepID=UPI001F3A6380|nr:TonB-dependent receptor [Rhizorhapis sp. SPR117]
MTKPISFASLLLIGTALVAPAAIAQTADQASQTTSEHSGKSVEVSKPGADFEGEIIVQGRYIPEPIRGAPEVISLLSAEDIARTGEGDIAGALQRVTGLSVVGGRYVYVRGLGERYSLALLNGLPIPSPEPLRRVVPLDLFPTSVLASSVVQKSYSVNYPGEFGGGVINLTTRTAPEEPFISFGLTGGIETETTARLGYTYYGADSDWTGFDDGTRDIPAALQTAINTGNPVDRANFTDAELQTITASLVNAPTTVVQRNRDIPANISAEISAGKSFDVGDNSSIGVIFTAGFSNNWQTKGGIQQITRSGAGEALVPSQDFRFLTTDNRIVVNGLLGLSGQFGDHVIRWTNFFVRDTLKQASIKQGTNDDVRPDVQLNQSRTLWYERQLFSTQLVGEFDFNDVQLDVRGTYANTQREAPYERTFSYALTDFFDGDGNVIATKPVNNFANGTGATIAFSDLNEDVYGAGADLSYKLPMAADIVLSAGYAYSKNERTALRRDFQYIAADGLSTTSPVAQLRPDYLLSDATIQGFNIQLQQSVDPAAAYDASLEVHAGYGQIEADVIPFVKVQTGVRYERGEESMTPFALFTGAPVLSSTEIKNEYWLPAATITWNFAEDMQLRLAGSKTIARPQFRELANQRYFDTDSDQFFRGNRFLEDSELINAEARFEWYFERGQRLSLAGFYKKIDKPIETIVSRQSNEFLVSFANAPEAQLYGAEVEVEKLFWLEGLGGDFWADRNLRLSGNYTWSQSKLKVPDGTLTALDLSGATPQLRTGIFNDGDPLTGQSDHIANLQIGLESTEGTSQQTFLINYASNRVARRGAPGQPDVIEKPGIRVDFVARETVLLGSNELELKFEARNIFGQDFEQFQKSGDSRIDINSYDVGSSLSLGATLKF